MYKCSSKYHQYICIAIHVHSEPSADLVTLITAAGYLENTTQYLFNETATIFTFTVGDITFTPDADSLHVTSSVKCSGGYVRNEFFCGA